MSAKDVFVEAQAALLNSECDPVEASAQALCALCWFVATEVDGATGRSLMGPLGEAVNILGAQDRLTPSLQSELRRCVRTHHDEVRRRART